MPMATREEQREYQRQWVAKRRSDFFLGKSCAECGSVEQLELDHVDRATKVHHAIWSWSQVRREAEIAKCQILCHDCHKAKSHASGDFVHPTYGDAHGTTRLSDEKVLEARERYAAGGVTHQALADEYGVGRSTITEAINGTWRSVATPL